MELKIKITNEDVGFSYQSIKSLLSKLSEIERKKEGLKKLTIHLDADMGDRDSFEPTLTMLWRMAEHYRSLECKKEFIYKGSTQKLLNEAHFFDRLTGKSAKLMSSVKIPIHYESFTPFRPQKTSAVDTTLEKIISETTRKSFDENNNFHKEIKAHMFEVLNNTFDHSESKIDAGVACFIREEVSGKKHRMSFCVADMGQGVRASFRKNINLRDKIFALSDAAILSEITKLRISCNPGNSRHPDYPYPNGGLGLFFLKEFIKYHRDGILLLVSQKGYYYFDSSGREKTRNLESVAWPGLVVFFTIKIDQDKNPEYLDMIRELMGIDDVQVNIV